MKATLQTTDASTHAAGRVTPNAHAMRCIIRLPHAVGSDMYRQAKAALHRRIDRAPDRAGKARSTSVAYAAGVACMRAFMKARCFRQLCSSSKQGMTQEMYAPMMPTTSELTHAASWRTRVTRLRAIACAAIAKAR